MRSRSSSADALEEIRVLVVDDSAYARVTLSKLLEDAPGIRVIGSACDGDEAIRKILSLAPAVVTLDLEMPRLDGFAVLRWLSENRPTPTVVVSSRQAREDVLRALDLGAVDFIVKPAARPSASLREIREALGRSIRAVAAARVRPDRGKSPARLSEVSPAETSAGLLVIGASTGGPPAIGRLMAALPPLGCPAVVAQHMPAGFTRLFAGRLDRLCAFPVTELAEQEELLPGRAYVVAGGRHAGIQRSDGGFHARLFRPSPRDLHVPSVDRLFRTAVEAAGAGTVGVVLTGMGDDGREGMLSIVARGGHTIAESEQTAVVYGMPREAIEARAATEVLPLDEIPAAIVRALRRLGRAGTAL
jgi:two-component system, chemotaxis family, protein-glutamate methylesterase/glutaminase